MDQINTVQARREGLKSQYQAVRSRTEELARPLVVEDYGIQAMADASPPKWHLAHTTWFFETFILSVYDGGYVPYHPEFRRLFNSYYETVGDFWPRADRGLLSRPTVANIYEYRQHVDEALCRFIAQAKPDIFVQVAERVVLGLNHEQQHQELLLTDVLYNFSVNPLYPQYRPLKPLHISGAGDPGWVEFPSGLYEIGWAGPGFCFDNETPRHRIWLDAYRLQDRLVTNREYLAFMEDGGYQNPVLWLSLGWLTVQSGHWRSPLYWVQRDGEWFEFTLDGLGPVAWDAPVTHISYFEADAFARWAGKRLPREGEWEVAASGADRASANLLETGWLRPIPAPGGSGQLRQMFGDVWEWTESAYLPYPGYRPLEGALGEYNGKFMAAQQVLRGGSCATPQSHLRTTYRNFFPAEARWQFTGIRLAEDAHA